MPRVAKPVPPGTAYPAVVIIAGMLLGAGVIVGAGLVATRGVQRIGGWLLAHADRVIVGAVLALLVLRGVVSAQDAHLADRPKLVPRQCSLFGEVA